MENENKRWLDALKQNPAAPAHYVAYQITDRRTVILGAEGGALTTDEDEKGRVLDVEVRVGTPALDNVHPLEDPNKAPLSNTARLGRIPYGTNQDAIRHALWLETDRRYREAADLYNFVREEQRVSSRKPEAPDFVHMKGGTFIGPNQKLEFDKKQWVKRVKSCSRRANAGVATRSNCQLVFEESTVYFVNSDGAVIQQSGTRARMSVAVGVKADDGMPLSRTEQRFASSPSDLPGLKEENQMIRMVNTDLNNLHKAPVVDPYVGPAILEGRAAAVFFHEVFGHRIEGHRQKGSVSGKTFTSKVNEEIMPEWLSVYDDPRVTTLNGTTLNGFYRFDDEGVPAHRADLVKSGVFTGFVQGRNPIKGFPKSNGHGRKEAGHFPIVSRQGNLIVEASRSVTRKQLRKQLVERIRAQKKPYGMVFTDISGGFTNTSRFMPQAFKVEPIMAFRVYPDGREELVRGVDIVGTPLTALGSIVSAARPVETFNGMCGAESGWVPVSASAPSLLLEKLEIERGFDGNGRAPILPAPSTISEMSSHAK